MIVHVDKGFPAENEFWRLLRFYQGGAVSHPIESTDFQKAYLVLAESDRGLSLDDLQEEFHFLDFIDL